MRNIYDVINQIKTFIPEEEDDFIHDLNSIMQSVRFSAPENIGMWWEELSKSISNYLPPSLGECNEWQMKVGLTIMGKM
jgi:hypothetical protein